MINPFVYTTAERNHLYDLCREARSSTDPSVVTADCWRKFITDSLARDPPCVARARWVARLSELADECDCDFIPGEHLI